MDEIKIVKIQYEVFGKTFTSETIPFQLDEEYMKDNIKLHNTYAHIFPEYASFGGEIHITEKSKIKMFPPIHHIFGIGSLITEKNEGEGEITLFQTSIDWPVPNQEIILKQPEGKEMISADTIINPSHTNPRTVIRATGSSITWELLFPAMSIKNRNVVMSKNEKWSFRSQIAADLEEKEMKASLEISLKEGDRYGIIYAPIIGQIWETFMGASSNGNIMPGQFIVTPELAAQFALFSTGFIYHNLSPKEAELETSEAFDKILEKD